jgi:uncharacterized protein (DUF433 family)
MSSHQKVSERMDSMGTIQMIDLIAVNPKVRGSRPFILGATVTVADVVVAKVYQMRDVDEISEWFDLSVAPQETVECVARAGRLSCTTRCFPASATHSTAIHAIL